MGDSQTDEITIDSESIDKVTSSFHTLHVKDFEVVADPLDELRKNQESLIEALIIENTRFRETKASNNLSEMFNKVSYYHNKVLVIRKDMVSLHDRTSKLKKRALRLQQLKEKEIQNGR